jgi:SAM-dependent methyltransferase
MAVAQDHFSAFAQDYARHRPTYPKALFSWLATQAPSCKAAWDCACGNGQASLGLAEFFDHVDATDLSAEQIKFALPHPRIAYRVATAEEAAFAPASLDLATVAQAAHWLELASFYAGAGRALKPGGIIALWAYGLFECEPELDALVREFYAGPLGPYWPADRHWIEEGYRGLYFPFAEIPAPEFTMELTWSPAGLLDYLGTWSAVKRYEQVHGKDPRSLLEPRLDAIWAEASPKAFRWKLILKVGRI